MRVLICGDRYWGVKSPHSTQRMIMRAQLQQKRLFEWLTAFHNTTTITHVINGGAPGADTLGREWGEKHFLPTTTYPAQWHSYGKAAGPLRNQQMLDEGAPEVVVAFHDNLLESRGTADMVRRAKRAGLPVWVVTMDDEELR